MFLRILPTRWLEKQYVDAGADFGEAVSYAYMGECVGFAEMLEDWEELECEYARRGYRTIPLEDFVNHGGYGIPIPNLGVRRNSGEKPIFHAKVYRFQTRS